MTGKNKTAERGFTLVEMLIAVVVVLVGLVAVAQLVPTSVMLNANNRNDGMSNVFAQQMMEALREQPLTNTTFSDPLGVTCAPVGNVCNLGDPTQPGVVVGSPVVVNGANLAIIDFSASTVSGYSFPYIDPNDPNGATYDVRWAVITTKNGTIVTGKRFIVGVFRRNSSTTVVPITIDSMVEK
ncbi:MAG TPA: prepilin-type N-terminal cleavage/methylation domain-containing protein [Dongiaceae bacterium]|nr:prepilin-type N-terminal cleavage/methylation domain-containing protein [Dongiaceae bacterium]